MANEQNLIPGNKRSQSEARENGRKGARNRRSKTAGKIPPRHAYGYELFAWHESGENGK